MNLRRILPIELNWSLRRLLSPGKSAGASFVPGRASIWFLDAPDYGNAGDLAIGEAMIRFIEKNKNPAHEFVVLGQSDVHASIKKVKKAISAGDVICLAGGGNMGVAYPGYEANRRKIINAFPDNRIVIFPSTIDYSGGCYARCEFRRAIKVYARHGDLHIFARERTSYGILKEHFANPSYLCPDMALALPITVKPEKREGIGICLRKDDESAMTVKERDDMVSFAGKKCQALKILDTLVASDVLGSRPGQKIIADKISEFAACRLVITDRLHGMIFSYLSGTPCIVFDNRNRKCSGVHEWIKDCGFVIGPDHPGGHARFMEDAVLGRVSRAGDGGASALTARFDPLAACIGQDK
jgi:pyruvyl transferase EpsI